MKDSLLLSTSGLAIGYPGKNPRPVAAGLELTLRRGELVCLIGPNGAGKSTLLRTLAGMQKPLGGRVLLNGEDLHQIEPRQLARHLAVVLTDRVGVGLLAARSVVELGRHPHTGWSGRLGPEDHKIVDHALQRVGAEHLAGRELVALSDGEQQRVMIARALAQEPQLLILDEVTAFLDLPRRVEILALLRRLAREEHCGILLSIHDLDLALRHADQVWLLSPEAGLIAGTPEALVLAGDFDRAFAGEGLRFDRQKGLFEVARPALEPARLVGEPGSLATIWAGRTLERLGYELVRESEPAKVTVEVLAREQRWLYRLEREGQLQELDSIEAFAAALCELQTGKLQNG